MQLYYSQFEDILKLWLYTDGPLNILNRINSTQIADLKHDCDYCLDLLSQKENINKLLNIDGGLCKEI